MKTGAPVLSATRSISARASSGCAPMMAGTPFFRMPAFSWAMAVSVFAEILLVIIVNGGDDGERRLGNDIGCIEPAAEAHFKNEIVGRGSREGEKRRRRGDFEKGDGRVAIGGFAFLQQGRQLLLGDGFAGHINALVKFHEVGRGIAMNLEARLLENGPDIGNGGALAVGSGHVNDRRQVFFRISQQRQNPLHALKAEINDLGMQGEQPVQYGITARHGIIQR